MPRKLKKELTPLDIRTETIGQRIARIRKERGLTQKELAEKVGITQTLISDYETGRVRIFADMVTRFAVALGVHTDLIHGLKDFKEKNTNPSLRFFRRFKKIEELSPLKQKNILRTIDDLIKAAEK